MRRLSDGYFYIYLPPIFMCLPSVVLMYLSKKTCYFTLYVAVLSDQEHMTTTSESHSEPSHDSLVMAPLYLHAAVGERIIVCVSLFQSE